MTTKPLDIFASRLPANEPSTPYPYLVEARKITDDLLAKVMAGLSAWSRTSRHGGWDNICIHGGNRMGVVEAFRAMVTDGLASLQGGEVPPIYQLTPAPPEHDLTDCVDSAIATGRAIYQAIAEAMQGYSALSAIAGWDNIKTAGNVSREDAVIALIAQQWPAVSSFPVPVIHAQPLPTEGGE